MKIKKFIFHLPILHWQKELRVKINIKSTQVGKYK
jgi:hypothetical protein